VKTNAICENRNGHALNERASHPSLGNRIPVPFNVVLSDRIASILAHGTKWFLAVPVRSRSAAVAFCWPSTLAQEASMRLAHAMAAPAWCSAHHVWLSHEYAKVVVGHLLLATPPLLRSLPLCPSQKLMQTETNSIDNQLRNLKSTNLGLNIPSNLY
jgi:hypothetical protein